MIEASNNQLYNVHNKFQGDAKKVLCVCSAGLLRSATMQNVLIKEYGYNARNCGTVDSYALIPISEALIVWADEIIFVNKENYDQVHRYIDKWAFKNKCKVLNIPDMYSFNDPTLVSICKEQYDSCELGFNIDGKIL